MRVWQLVAEANADSDDVKTLGVFSTLDLAKRAAEQHHPYQDEHPLVWKDWTPEDTLRRYWSEARTYHKYGYAYDVLSHELDSYQPD